MKREKPEPVGELTGTTPLTNDERAAKYLYRRGRGPRTGRHPAGRNLMTIRDFLQACLEGVGGFLFIILAVFAFMGAAQYIVEWLK